jgi:hypothetical protein
MATPWSGDGSFNDSNLDIAGEMPVDCTDLTGNHADGVGFCESVGFEYVVSYRKRALQFYTSAFIHALD